MFGSWGYRGLEKGLLRGILGECHVETVEKCKEAGGPLFASEQSVGQFGLSQRALASMQGYSLKGGYIGFSV